MPACLRDAGGGQRIVAGHQKRLQLLPVHLFDHFRRTLGFTVS